YVNDDKMIITSLNLYEFSMANNKEMGVLIDKNDAGDIQLFEDAFKEVDYINETSQKFELSASKPSFKNSDFKSNIERSHSKNLNNQTGYCIRTGVEIPFDIEKPLSREAYKKWNERANPDFAENYCHFSGEPSNGGTCVRKPILSKNWKKAREIFDLH